MTGVSSWEDTADYLQSLANTFFSQVYFVQFTYTLPYIKTGEQLSTIFKYCHADCNKNIEQISPINNLDKIINNTGY